MFSTTKAYSSSYIPAFPLSLILVGQWHIKGYPLIHIFIASQNQVKTNTLAFTTTY